MKKYRDKKGFTLIELLVVIAIIALLLSIVLPSLKMAKEYAKRVVCQSNLMQWGLFFSAYAEDYDDAFCAGPYEYTDSEGVHQNSNADLWMYTMENYSNNPDMLLCISANRERGGNSSKSPWGSPDERPFYGSYGLNGWLYDPPAAVTDVQGHSTANNWRSLNVQKRYNVPVLLDSSWHTGYPLATDLPPMTEGQDWREDGNETENHMRQFAIDRHDKGLVNVLFMDSGVREVGLKELWRLKWHRNYDTSTPLPEWPEWMRRFKNPD